MLQSYPQLSNSHQYNIHSLKYFSVGANVVVGSAAPIRGLVSALGQASSVLINTMHANSIALPSAVITKGKETTVIVGADERCVCFCVWPGRGRGGGEEERR